MGQTSIEWTDYTFNPVWGCSKVSIGPLGACEHCYAESFARRVGRPELWQGQFRTFGEKYWRAPFNWNWRAERDGVRRRVFCASMADVFDKDWPAGIRERLWDLIEETPHLDWLLLTKRIGNATRMFPERWGPTTPANVWLGATVVTQEEADRDIPKLLATEAAVHFLSIEPLLEPLRLHGGWLLADQSSPLATIDWVIVGGESSPHARPMHPDWARDLRNQCVHAGVPFLFKQWGEWAPAETAKVGRIAVICYDGELLESGRMLERQDDNCAEIIRRVGKKVAGRLLDGRTWDQFPSEE